jgi:predicted CXXCH cytochrome family protein
MAADSGKFVVSYTDRGSQAPAVFEKDAITIGRLASCDIVLNHKAVSRVHAGINFLDSRFFLINLSASNIISLNGRPLPPRATDVLAEGDIIQVGPFALTVEQRGDEISLAVQKATTEEIMKSTRRLPPIDAIVKNRLKKEDADVLKVFWEKRTRDKEEWGSRLRPTEKPQPGKAVINWKPTRDLRRPWRVGLFVWAILIFGALAAFAYMRYPETYAPKPLANPHAAKIESSTIAVQANGNSCTTCHMANAPIENACISCHQAEQFHVSNTKAHEEAGITCTACHKEHRGPDFDLTASAIQSCAECHNDANNHVYNGKSVRTAHGGSYGYPLESGEWKWKGVYREIADAIPEINGSATADANEQARRSRHFHAVHVYRLKAPTGILGDSNGLVSCSSCHTTPDNLLDTADREVPRKTCAVCHTTQTGTQTQDPRFVAGQVNCISCHVQHPYSGARWSEFLTPDALQRRKDAVSAQIKRLNSQ